MDDKNKNIDDLFRDNLKNREFDYKHEYWDKMDSLLESQPLSGGFSSTGAKILGLNKSLFIGLVTVIPIATGLTVYLSTNNNAEDSDKKDEIIILDTQNDNNPAPQQYVETLDTTEIKNSFKEIEAQNEVVDENYTQPAKQNQKPVENNITKEDFRLNADKKTDTGLTASKDENLPQESDIERPDETIHYDDVKKELSYTMPADSNIKIGTVSKGLKEKEKTLVEEDPAKNELKDKSAYAEINPEIAVNDTGSTEIYESENQPDNKGALDPGKKEKYPGRLYIHMGRGLHSTFSSATDKTDWSFSPALGFGYRHPINDNLYLSLGAGFVQREGHKLLRNSTRTSYFLFKESDSIQLNTKVIRYLDIPLGVNYCLNENANIGGGIMTSFVLNTISKKDHIISDPFNYSRETKDVTGYKEGINNFVLGLHLEGEYRIMKSATLGLMFNRSLMDQTDDKVFGSNKKDYITEFQVLIRWILF